MIILILRQGVSSQASLFSSITTNEWNCHFMATKLGQWLLGIAKNYQKKSKQIKKKKMKYQNNQILLGYFWKQHIRLNFWM